MKRIMTIFVLFVTIIIILAFFMSAARCENTILYVCVGENSYLNGRARPSKHSEITMRLYKGDTVEVVRAVDGWIEIIGGETGTSFVDSRYVSESLESFTVTNKTSGRVRIRESIDGKTVGYVKSGKSVTVERTMLGWGYIGSGWVNLEYFE